MSISELNGLTLSIVDDKLIEQLGFFEEQVIATLGIEGEFICAPTLSVEVTGPFSIVIGDDETKIVLDNIEVQKDKVKCLRNGKPAEYEVIARAEDSCTKRNLP